MANEVDQAIAESLLEDLQKRAAEQGYRSLLNGDEVAKHTAGGVGFRSDSDHESIIYSTDSGEPRIIPTVYLAKTLQKRRAGKKAFVAGDPETGQPIGEVPEYKLGNYMCFLHPDHPDRAELEEMGIGPDVICGDYETAPAAHIRDEFNLRLHEEKKHPMSFAIRAQAIARQEREREREAQQAQTAAIMELARGNRQRAG